MHMVAVKRQKRSRNRHFLLNWRVASKMSQERAADLAGFDRTTLSRLERGEIPYNQDTLERLASAYGCNPEDLIAIDPFAPDYPRLVYTKLRAASQAVQKQALGVVEVLLKSG